jgi:Uncharacterized protein conserved in bacteria (DUF2135)
MMIWDRLSYVLTTYDATSHMFSADGGPLVSKVKLLVPATELDLPLATLAAPALTKADVTPAYVSAMSHDPDVATPFVDEAERRRAPRRSDAGLRPQAIHAIPGKYTVQVHYFGNNSNQLVAETYIIVTVTTHVGTPEESVERFNVMLPHVNDVTTITTVTF